MAAEAVLVPQAAAPPSCHGNAAGRSSVGVIPGGSGARRMRKAPVAPTSERLPKSAS
jgi:hypothetical protein